MSTSAASQARSQKWAESHYAQCAPDSAAARRTQAAVKVRAAAKHKAVTEVVSSRANSSTQTFLLQEEKCYLCGMVREGWHDHAQRELSRFYCVNCWSEYDAWVVEEGEETADQNWHTEIISADSEISTSLIQKAFNWVKSSWARLSEDPQQLLPPETSNGSGNNSPRPPKAEEDMDEEEEERDVLAPLPGEAGSAAQRSDPQPAQRSHIIIMVDQSGSMRTLDVEKASKDEPYVRRIEAVLTSLSDFFRLRARDSLQDEFSLISFNNKSTIHFQRKSASFAAEFVSKSKVVAQRQTEYVIGLDAVSRILKQTPDGASLNLVIFSDGRPGDATKMLTKGQELLSSYANLHIHTIGFGDSLTSFDYLQQLASIGNGLFIPSGCTMASLGHAFSCVSSTITSITSSSSAYTFLGAGSDTDSDGRRASKSKRVGQPRVVQFELPNQCAFGQDGKTLQLMCHRSWFLFDGNNFETRDYYWRGEEYQVSIRTSPYTKGGMRLVYGFQDSTIRQYNRRFTSVSGIDEILSESRMVAKLSKFIDIYHNSYDVVASYARSSAAARFFARCFDIQLANSLGAEARPTAKIIFVECFLYTISSASAPAGFLIAERYLPGIFLKYNSNKGYVNEEAPDSEIAQAFSHFTHTISLGKLMVLDLQGVHLSTSRRRRSHLIFTDPQVVSLERSFGPADLGSAGMSAFFKSHRCGCTCQKLGIATGKVAEQFWRTPTSAVKKDGSGSEKNAKNDSLPSHHGESSGHSSSRLESGAFQHSSESLASVRFLKSIQNNGITPDVATVRSAVADLEKAGRTQEAFELKVRFSIPDEQPRGKKYFVHAVSPDGAAVFTAVSVRKHDSQGCAVISLGKDWVRDAFFEFHPSAKVTIAQVQVELKQQRDVPDEIFAGWGRQAEKTKPLPEDTILQFFKVWVAQILSECRMPVPKHPQNPQLLPPMSAINGYPQNPQLLPPMSPINGYPQNPQLLPPMSPINGRPHTSPNGQPYQAHTFPIHCLSTPPFQPGQPYQGPVQSQQNLAMTPALNMWTYCALLYPQFAGVLNANGALSNGANHHSSQSLAITSTKAVLSSTDPNRTSTDHLEPSKIVPTEEPNSTTREKLTRDRTESQEQEKILVHGINGKRICLPIGTSQDDLIQAIANNFGIAREEQHLLQEQSVGGGSSGSCYRVEWKMNVATLRFTHDTIRPNFRDGRPIYELLNDLNSGNVDPLRDLEPLDVVICEEFRWSLSNRRLWALKCYMATLARDVWVRVRVRPPDAEFRQKRTTMNSGVSVQVTRSRSPSPAERLHVI